ncbi:D-aspartate oxidase isoform X2 [Pelobates cultripes]|uniref:D-aspartate oxidase n=1 Tax=Pelobates cultripes TaxID=61616 RepID=A0AAD1RG60_PELCU|nr:D-aspartate oxidase isoform X2 [Pelobates cultripes]
MEKARVAVIGGGLVGLSTAVCISESLPQCSVTVISENFSPYTTGDVAAGCLIPHTFPETPLQEQKNWFRETFDYLFNIANSGEATEAGICFLSGWQVYKKRPKEAFPFWWDVVLGFRVMTENELEKFPRHTFGQTFTTLKCQSTLYLPWMEKRFKSNGGKLIARKVDDVWQLHGTYDIIVNCTGIGSRELTGDILLYPVKGQVLEVHAPWIKHFIRDGDENTYIYPGINNTTLGGTRHKHDWSLLPDFKISKEIQDRCCELEPSLQGVGVIREKVGLRPVRAAVRLEKEVLFKKGQKLHMVHNYGHGASGYSVHIGTAKRATKLVEELIPLIGSYIAKSKL